MSLRKSDFCQLVIQCVDAVGGSAPKSVILRAVSTATKIKFRGLDRQIEDALNELIVQCMIHEHDGNYYIKHARDEITASDRHSGNEDSD
ncbi:uncharacterized protein LOC120285303 [Drosophila simulans]|uniref:uncharacterized protein LOC120285303 n=1 Tax=Drosophila simulans TaxID=7240 RepID=UPI00192CECB7|nr:uncharacterized protein LOC120285303 [Drosophila simulans]